MTRLAYSAALRSWSLASSVDARSGPSKLRMACAAGLYGAYPTLALGGPDDVGVDSWEQQGRWIPTSSVDQYAATLLGWMGASDSQLNSVLPNLPNFGSARNLGFV